MSTKKKTKKIKKQRVKSYNMSSFLKELESALKKFDKSGLTQGDLYDSIQVAVKDQRDREESKNYNYSMYGSSDDSSSDF